VINFVEIVNLRAAIFHVTPIGFAAGITGVRAVVGAVVVVVVEVVAMVFYKTTL